MHQAGYPPKKLRAGEKLPSKRSFAKNLGVSTITVESAYAQLVAELVLSIASVIMLAVFLEGCRGRTEL